MTLTYTPVIGLEIHVQLLTKTKLFCGCSTDYIGAVPNSNICPVCTGQPGTLPILNAEAVRLGARAALALHCTLRHATRFHRKNYFYPDLPKAYQITQYDLPLGEKGFLDISLKNGIKRIGITRLHLEEDAGKLVHAASDGRLSGATDSLVDYNRGGVPLAEIVSEPDLASPEEAREYVSAIRRLVRYLEVSNGDMEAGSLRVDANISLKVSDGRWGNRTEVKNVNSLRALERAIFYEMERQEKLLEKGLEILQETRHWDDAKGITHSSRGKEDAHDYRYFPEPDIPPLVLSKEDVQKMREALPELPWEKEKRFQKEYGLEEEDVKILVEDGAVACYFEDLVSSGSSPDRASKWMQTEVFRVCNDRKISLQNFPVSSKVLGKLLRKIDAEGLSTTGARDIFECLLEEKCSLEEAFAKTGVASSALEGNALKELIKTVCEEQAETVEILRQGKDAKGKKRKFLQGQIMRASRGQAKIEEVEQMLEEFLQK
ncbi:MAG TPA: Asp-tRNA(Asn)/Glu-tRNA(Gln) amidotransferase subunit GatB [Synergistaceae bacterium]|nr:Asp-tRNA(Asn)/Glu-tRNA(Gln) amidotransferase subunit GatB [Synergistaceae bacterium]